MILEIFTDGACAGNPGPGGWGIIIRAEDDQIEFCGGELKTTNNRMEMLAVIRALEKLPEPCTAKIYSDSQYVIKGISEWIHGWKARGWKTAAKDPVKNEDLWRKLDELRDGHTIEWIWVKGHAGHAENERADELARKGLNAALAANDTVDYLTDD